MLRVLVVEDSKDDTDLVIRYLTMHFGELPISRQVYNVTQMDLALMEPEGWDCVICDYAIPGFDWPNALNMIRKWRKGVLFIVVSGVIGDDKGKAAIEDGADDYLPKSRIREIGALVERWLRVKNAHEAHRIAVDELLDRIKKA